MFWKLASSVSAEYDSAPAVIRGMPVHTVAGEEETASKSRKSEVIESHRVCIFTQAGKRKDPWPQDISFKFVTAFLPALSMCQSSFRQSPLILMHKQFPQSRHVLFPRHCLPSLPPLQIHSIYLCLPSPICLKSRSNIPSNGHLLLLATVHNLALPLPSKVHFRCYIPLPNPPISSPIS